MLVNDSPRRVEIRGEDVCSGRGPPYLSLKTPRESRSSGPAGAGFFGAGPTGHGRVLAADARLACRFVCFGGVATRLVADEFVQPAFTEFLDCTVLAVRESRGLTAALDFRRGGPLLGGELRQRLLQRGPVPRGAPQGLNGNWAGQRVCAQPALFAVELFEQPPTALGKFALDGQCGRQFRAASVAPPPP
jgi:hypothetical protein